MLGFLKGNICKEVWSAEIYQKSFQFSHLTDSSETPHTEKSFYLQTNLWDSNSIFYVFLESHGSTEYPIPLLIVLLLKNEFVLLYCTSPSDVIWSMIGWAHYYIISWFLNTRLITAYQVSPFTLWSENMIYRTGSAHTAAYMNCQ